MALVFFVIFLFKSLGHIFKVSSISVTTGIAPTSTIASITAIKVKDCVITSSLGFTPAARRAILIAAVPEVTHIAYLEFTYLANLFSNSFTLRLL